jgi:hypothetical protein
MRKPVERSSTAYGNILEDFMILTDMMQPRLPDIGRMPTCSMGPQADEMAT